MAGVKEKYRRTADDVQKVITLSKLDESELTGITQVLQFSPESDETSHIKLLELDSHLLQAVKEGDSLTFRGSEEESVVLCSTNRTYDLQEAETSNSLLLVPDCKFSKETGSSAETCRILQETTVKGVFYTYYEVAQCRPRLNKLHKVLASSAFNGKEYESLVDQTTLYNWEKLVQEIQASEDELREALSSYLIVNINGYLRSLTFEYETRALSLMLDLIDENSWETDEIDKEITFSLLEEFIPDSVFQVLFHAYAEPSGKTKENGELLFRYNEEKVCKFLAKVLLAASPVNTYDEFMEAWRIGTPECMEPKDSWLGGIALIVFNTRKNVKEIVSYPAVDLPDGINQRFEELFKTKEKWTIEEITPYIIDLTTNKTNVNGLLTKYARSSMSNGIKYYSSKHCK
ncbi:sister chromatid cohesion protein DCC1 [Diprion similis]|uniref:sister chromatid cohesion protein DCC1 n=1 Tax=Diprion similis TaxID=362088 RepID=UPI001EF88877|nr:sister chromatid cohesion protein DCC1 [Diprion similis]